MNALDKTEWEQYAEIFNALAGPIRVRILSMVAADDEVACTTLETVLPISKSTISYHVRILRAAGLLTVRKEGRFYFYTLRSDVMEHFLPGVAERLGQIAPAEPLSA